MKHVRDIKDEERKGIIRFEQWELYPEEYSLLDEIDTESESDLFRFLSFDMYPQD